MSFQQQRVVMSVFTFIAMATSVMLVSGFRW